MGEPLVVSIPTVMGTGGVEITMYTPRHSPQSFNELQNESRWSRLFSIRNVFVSIFLITVILSAICLTVTSFYGQLEIVENDTQYKIDQINQIIIHNIADLFVWVETELTIHNNFFYNLTIPPNGTNLFEEWPNVSELMWSSAMEQPTGSVIEMCFQDGRFSGVEIFKDTYSVYTMDYNINLNETYFTTWAGNRSEPILFTNFSMDNAKSIIYVAPPYPYYEILRNESRSFLNSCNGPLFWEGVYGYVSVNDTSSGIFTVIGAYNAICNKFSSVIGYYYVGIGIDSYDMLLKELADENAGQFFIMDTEDQLVASSSSTPVFTRPTPNQDLVRTTMDNINERWIRDVVEKIHGDLSDRNFVVSINGTKYYLSVNNWSQYDGIDWVVVLLIDFDFLMGSTYANIKRSVVISIVIAVASVIVALFVTYYTTKPLFLLARNMQKIARLDLDSVKETDSPKLIEVKRLYQSYLGMNAALRSFKKFVPVQIVSRIIRSNKEVVAELKFRHITVMFQDIEGFTTLSETMNPANLAKLTSEYMGVMTTIICKNGGTIDKYVGDCIMSLFNAPEEVKNHPTAATGAAVECIIALIEMNKEWMNKYGVEMNFRTGIHTGEVLIGNMGSDNRMNYTAFGDSVNIAARLEGVNKLYGTRIIVSKDVHCHFPKDKFVTRKLGKIRVSGKSIATTVFEVRGSINPSTEHLFDHYEKALLASKENRLEDALVLIECALEVEPKDKASMHLQERIKEGMASSNWSYVEDLVKY